MFGWLRRKSRNPAGDSGVSVTFRFAPPQLKRPIMQTTSFSTIQKQRVTPQFLNAAGQSVPVDGIPLWSVDDSSIAAIDPAPDGLSCVVLAGAPGVTVVTVRADAKLGEGEVEVSGQFEVTITESGAVRVEFQFGEIENK